MKGYRCIRTGKVFLTPPGPERCPGGENEPVELSGRGQVYSCTTLYASAEPFERDLPFQIAIIELEEGPRLTARIEGEKVTIGDAVRQAGQKNGAWIFTREG